MTPFLFVLPAAQRCFRDWQDGRGRAQKNGEDGEESSRTKTNLMDSLVPKQCIKFTDRQTDRHNLRILVDSFDF